MTAAVSPSPSALPTTSPTPFDNDVFISTTIPAQIATNNLVPVGITIENTGNTTWMAGGPYWLSVMSDPCFLIGISEIEIGPSDIIPPGTSYSFGSTLIGPASAGSCSLSLRMKNSETGVFGPSFETTIDVIPAQNGAVAMSSTMPPKIPPGSKIGIGISFLNSGNTTWSAEGNYSLSVIEDACSILGGPGTRIPIEPGILVTKNLPYQFLTTITAPISTGSCSVKVRMAEQGLGAFGDTMTLSTSIESPPNSTRSWDEYD